MMGKNMTAMLAVATAAKGKWINVEANRAGKNAAASLTTQGKLQARTLKDGTIQVKTPSARSTKSAGPARKPGRPVKSTSKLQVAIAKVRADAELSRADLVAWLQSEFGMTKAGASTYAHLARTAAAKPQDEAEADAE